MMESRLAQAAMLGKIKKVMSKIDFALSALPDDLTEFFPSTDGEALRGLIRNMSSTRGLIDKEAQKLSEELGFANGEY